MVKKILIVGSGAREHCIASTLKRSPQNPEVFAFMSSHNPGLIELCKETVVGDTCNADLVMLFALRCKPDFAIIGPENPLAAGVVDALAQQGIPSVGPEKELAQLESSKSFTRSLLNNYNIPGNPEMKTFSSMEGVHQFLEALGEYVIKADGLHGGKGVKLSGEHLLSIEEALAYAEECIESDGKIVVEEKLVGEEFSLLSFSDGEHVVDMPVAQDHKRAFEQDEGPNTGGMGSYGDADHLLPFITEEDVQQAHEITEKTCQALKKELGNPFKGIMYGGFMKTKNGVKLIEYNARFGDPEVFNILPLLTSDFVTICEHIIEGTLKKEDVIFEKKATVCKYVVPQGYPTDPVKAPITLGEMNGALVFYGAVDEKEGQLHMTGSRAVSLVGVAPSLSEAEHVAEHAAQQVEGQVFYRKDIGTPELIQKRIDHLNAL